MNNLNSVLIEGVIAEIRKYSASEKKCFFTIESIRFKKTNIFSVLATGEIAEACSMKKGRLVNVVGEMETTKNNAVFIEAVHIEFMSEKTGKEN